MTVTIFVIVFAIIVQVLPVDARDRELESRRLRCKSPLFLDKLPEDARAELKLVWSNYHEGDDCISQRFATNKILRRLPSDLQDRIFTNRNYNKALCNIPPFFDKLPVSAQQTLTDIWLDYVIGEDCNKQLQGTRTALLSLTSEQWKDLRPKAIISEFLAD